MINPVQLKVDLSVDWNIPEDYAEGPSMEQRGSGVILLPYGHDGRDDGMRLY